MHAYPAYPVPTDTLLRLLWAAVRRRKLSFRQEASTCVKRLKPPMCLLPPQDETGQGYTQPRAAIFSPTPCLVTVNHYSRPGFQAWWIALAVSAALPVDIHWIVTSAWRSFQAGKVHSRLVANTVFQVTRRLFPYLAQVYGFTSMPPMPPEPGETVARAAAVRRLLAYARRNPQSVIGLAPEGQDSPGGQLMLPPSGVGRFVSHLCIPGRPILPLGLYEMDGQLVLKLGAPYFLEIPPFLEPDDLDLLVRQQVMAKIAVLLPGRLQPQVGSPVLDRSPVHPS